MNVLVVTNMYPTESRPYSGVFVKEQVDALRALGLNLEVLHIDGSDKLNYLRGLIGFRRTIKHRHFDIIHAHYVHCGWIARMQIGLPVVVTSHGSDTLGYECWFLKRLHPFVDAMTLTSRQNQERSGLFATHLLPCGVNTSLFQPADQHQARTQLGWAQDCKYMLYVGRDAPRKRLDILRDAHNTISAVRSEVRLFLATDVSHSEVPVYMSAADVFVFASETEGSPVVIKEAMACNLPIVSVDVGDVAEMIDGVDQCHICARSADSMAESVLNVLDSGKRSNGREIAVRFSLEATAQRVLDIYQSVLYDSRRGRH